MLCPCLLLALTPAAPDLALTWEVALVYSVWELQLSGTAGEPYVLLPSLLDGPVAPPALGGTVLDIGLDLTQLARFGVLDGAGEGLVSYDVPQNPAFVGLPIRAQAFTFPGPAGLVDDLSNAVQATVAAIGTTHLLPEPVVKPRRHHTATQLADGRVVVIGGESAGAGGSWPLEIELYDPQTGEFTVSGASLSAGRAHHTADLLPDGRVLVVGGVRPNGLVLQSAVFYDPVNDTFGNPSNLVSPRVGHTTHVLPDGDLLVIGGSTLFSLGGAFGLPLTGTSLAKATVERYDVQNGSFGAAADLPDPRFLHDSAALDDGRILLVGGVVATPGGSQTTADARLYLPAMDVWQQTAPLPAPRALHSVLATADGGALAMGGAEITYPLGVPKVTPSLATWLYTPGGAVLWKNEPSLNTIMQGGERVCLPRPKTPPPDEPVAPGTFPPLEPVSPDITYFAGSGYTSLDASTGQGTLSTTVQMIDPSFDTWEQSVEFIEAREGESFTPLAGTFRVLRIGASSTPGDPGGEETVLDWPLP